MCDLCVLYSQHIKKFESVFIHVKHNKTKQKLRSYAEFVAIRHTDIMYFFIDWIFVEND